MAVQRAQLLGSACVQVGASEIGFAADMRYQALAYLAFQGSWVPREKLAFLFWPDTTTRDGRHHLRQLLKRMRALPWLDGLEADRHRVRWAVATDAREFAEAARDRRLDDALELYRGPLLDGIDSDRSREYDAWLAHERRRLHDVWRDLALARARELVGEARPDAAARLLEACLARAPLDEDALRAYMLALARARRTSRALEAYERFEAHVRDELGVAPSAATVELAGRIRAATPLESPATVMSSASAVPVPSVGRAPGASRLPTPATPFIGRDLELGHIIHLLAERSCRLLTLTGPGGVGKSRLAQAAAEELAHRYPGGVVAVALEPVHEAVDVPDAIAAAVGVGLSSGADAVTQLATRLRGERILLVLDNVEHLADAADFIAALLDACPELDALVTSRARLRLQREQLFPVRGMSLPPDPVATIADAESYDAVRLFVQTVRRLRPTYAVQPRDLATILDVLRRVGGMPLAVELVAAWCRSMSLDEIAAALRGGAELPESRLRDRPARHRSMREVFERSWKLLQAEERRALSALAVFRGGFRREAAEAVADASPAMLARLVDASVVYVDGTGRYRLHPLFRGYAEGKLSDQARDRLRSRHAEHYVRVLESLDAEVRRGRETIAIEQIDAEWDDLREAMRWCATLPDAVRLRTCVELMNRRFERRGNHREALDLLDVAAARLDRDEPEQLRTLGRVLSKAGWYHQRLGAYDDAERITRQGIEIAEAFGERTWVAWGLNTLGAVADRRGDYAEARSRYEQALAIGRSVGDDELCAAVLDNLAQTEARSGAHASAQRRYEEALALHQQLGLVTGTVTVLNNLGSLHGELRELDAAERCFRRAHELAREIGDDRMALYLLVNLGYVAQDRGRHLRARETSEEALAKAREHREKHLVAPILTLSARAAAALGDGEAAERAFREAVRAAWGLGDVPELLGALSGLAELHAILGDTARAVPLLQAVAGHAATGPREREEAERILEELTVEAAADGGAAGDAMDVDTSDGDGAGGGPGGDRADAEGASGGASPPGRNVGSGGRGGRPGSDPEVDLETIVREVVG